MHQTQQQLAKLTSQCFTLDSKLDGSLQSLQSGRKSWGKRQTLRAQELAQVPPTRALMPANLEILTQRAESSQKQKQTSHGAAGISRATLKTPLEALKKFPPARAAKASNSVIRGILGESQATAAYQRRIIEHVQSTPWNMLIY